MIRNLFFGFLLVVGFGLTLSSCAPGVYGGVGYGPGYYGGYGPGYYGGYGPGYYGRPVIVAPRPRFYGGYRAEGGYRSGGGYRGGGSFRGGSGGGRRGGR